MNGVLAKFGCTRTQILSVILGLSLFLTGCDVELFSELDEKNANDVLLVLKKNGISASKTRVDQGKWQIAVHRDSVEYALATVSNHGLPRTQFVSLGDVFSGDGLVSTPAEERQRYAFAVSQELSYTLMQIDGVVVARVHPVIPLQDPLSDYVAKPSAAVFIKHLHNVDLAAMVPSIKSLVAQSIEGLEPANVSLTFSAASPVPTESQVQSLPVETARVERSSLMLGGLLALLVITLWSISGLSGRLAVSTQDRMLEPTRKSALEISSSLRLLLYKARKTLSNKRDGYE